MLKKQENNTDVLLEQDEIWDYTPLSTYMVTKRLADIALVLLSLPITLPIIVITALIIRLETRGRAVFNQQRIGLDNQVFVLYKLRSMQITDPAQPAAFAVENDSRITRVGKVIRRLRIDELPQIWNVMKGDMSIIGPRPEQVHFVQEYQSLIPKYTYRHTIKPGITGLAQIEQGYVEDLQGTIKKLEYDLHYVENMSIKLDISILFKTIYTVTTGFGAR